MMVELLQFSIAAGQVVVLDCALSTLMPCNSSKHSNVFSTQHPACMLIIWGFKSQMGGLLIISKSLVLSSSLILSSITITLSFEEVGWWW
jgi:hypothetical protein